MCCQRLTNPGLLPECEASTLSTDLHPQSPTSRILNSSSVQNPTRTHFLCNRSYFLFEFHFQHYCCLFPCSTFMLVRQFPLESIHFYKMSLKIITGDTEVTQLHVLLLYVNNQSAVNRSDVISHLYCGFWAGELIVKLMFYIVIHNKHCGIKI